MKILSKGLRLLIVATLALSTFAEYVPNEILVKPKRKAEFLELAQQLNLQFIRSSGPIMRFRIPEGPLAPTVPALAQLLGESGLVHWAEPNHILTLGAYDIRTKDPKYLDGTQWHLHNEGGAG